jgi:hypothetical protein
VSEAEAQFRERVEVATALQEARRWEQAGVAWVEAARVAVDAGALLAARQSLHAAAEAFRRDDRLAPAQRALETLLSLGPDPVQAAMARIHLAAVRAARGDRDGAMALRLPDETAGLPAAAQAAGIDVAIGVAWQWGTKDQVRALVAQLAAAEGVDGVATAFRTAQLRRADGDLAEASADLQALTERMSGDGGEGARAGIAAAHAEQAEIALLAGRPAEALAGYERAAAAQEAAGRRSLAWQAEAGRVRAAVEAGLDVILTRLEAGVAYAAARGLVPLRVELSTALGEGLAGRDVAAAAARLGEALALADAAGLRLAAGRARLGLARRTRCAPDQREALLARAAADLADDVPWRDRALTGGQ